MKDSTAYKSPLYLRNAHLQTVLNSQGPRRLRAQKILKRLNSEKLILQAADGTRLLADLDHAAKTQYIRSSQGIRGTHGLGSTQGDGPDRSALVILLHGWEGSSRSSYLVTTAASLLAQGFDVLRVNLRDHGDSHHLNPELFNSTRSPEVASALQDFVASHAYKTIFLAGFSLGGSFALRIAADAGVELGLNASIAVCPPTDPARAMEALNNGFFAYERYFFKRWHGSLQRKLQCFPELDYSEDLASAKSLDDLNRFFIPQHTIYSDVDDYFAAYALVGSRLSAMAMPAYLIAAADDPIIPVDDLNRIDPVETLQIETYRHGGHCGFLENLAARSWIEGRMLQILEGHM